VHSRGETKKKICKKKILKKFFAGVKQNSPTLQGGKDYLLRKIINE
jgi:hypothetical protein